MSARTIRRAAERHALKQAGKTISQSQLDANRANAQHSTGRITAAGKQTSSQNRRSHGLTGAFVVMPWEDASQFESLLNGLRSEYQPETIVEQSYVDHLAEHMWLRQRCSNLLAACYDPETHFIADEKQFALIVRYQTANERASDKCVNQLLKLAAAKRKEQIGFESQNRQAAAEARKIEAHEARLRLTNAKTRHCEIDSDIRQTCEAALPGHMRIPFEELSGAFRLAVADVSRKLQTKQAAA